MDFFRNQETARRKTGLLVVYLFIAILLITTCVYLAALVAIALAERKSSDMYLTHLWLNGKVFLGVALVTLIGVGIASLWKIRQLGSGGKAVAEMLGGRLIHANTIDLKERKLLNVVEEMALAAGMGVPPVYLLPEETGINAFAAGFSPSDAVIAVTQGTLDQLKREELQSVIAHEFSHVFNGDMRLNIRLMGVLHGLLVLSLVGAILARGEKNPLLVFGLALIALGYIGVLFGRLIKAAVSRQREYLADASSVQYTRNPMALSCALKKIGGLRQGSSIHHHEAEEASHFFFASGVGTWLTSAFNTHPPLAERIKRLDPSFNGVFPEINAEITGGGEEELPLQAFSPKASRPATPESTVQRVGQVEARHVEYVFNLLQNIPEALRNAAREPFQARSLVFGLLLSSDSATRESQIKQIESGSNAAEVFHLQILLPLLQNLPSEQRLPLLDSALPALRSLSEPQYRKFRAQVDALVDADQKLDVFELVLKRVLTRHLDPFFKKSPPLRSRFRNLSNLGKEASRMLSSLAHLAPQIPL